MNYVSGDISVINSFTNTVIKTIKVGGFPIAMIYNPSNGYIYVSGYGSGDITLIGGSIVKKTIDEPPFSYSIRIQS